MQTSLDNFSQMPDSSRVWIYTAQRALTNDEEADIYNQLQSFTQHWKAHGTKLDARFSILYQRFIVFVVNEENQNATGCSIDTSVHEMKKISQKTGIDFFNRLLVLYRDGHEVKCVSTLTFKQMAATGEVNEQTYVFDTTLQTLIDLRLRFEVPAEQAWTRKFFKQIAV